MNNMKNAYQSTSLRANISSSTTTVGTIVDLAGFVEVGKRNLKLIVGIVDCKLTTTTDQTIAVTWYESDTTLSSEGTAISGAAVSSGTTVGSLNEYNVLATKRYVFASAFATGTVPAWGVIASVIATRRTW